jgi:hypothetical protein
MASQFWPWSFYLCPPCSSDHRRILQVAYLLRWGPTILFFCMCGVGLPWTMIPPHFYLLSSWNYRCEPLYLIHLKWMDFILIRLWASSHQKTLFNRVKRQVTLTEMVHLTENFWTEHYTDGRPPLEPAFMVDPYLLVFTPLLSCPVIWNLTDLRITEMTKFM